MLSENKQGHFPFIIYPVRGPNKATMILQPNKAVFERAILGLIGMFNGDLIWARFVFF
jgi:hypothetical protein